MKIFPYCYVRSYGEKMRVVKAFKNLIGYSTISNIEDVFDLIENNPERVNQIPDEYINAQGDCGWSPLIYASFARQWGAATALLDRGANKNLRNNDDLSAHDFARLAGLDTPDRVFNRLVIS